MKTFTIRTEYIGKLEERIQKFIPKFERNGQILEYKQLGSFFKLDEYNVPHSYTEVEINGYSKIGDYQVVALICHNDNTNLIFTIRNEIDLPDKYRKVKGVCEHCNINRYRKETVVLYDGKEFKQVGKACLKEFTGLDVGLYALYLSFIKELESFENNLYEIEVEIKYISTKPLLLQAIMETKVNGYIPRYTTIYQGVYEDKRYNENNTTDKILKNPVDVGLEYEEDYKEILKWLNTTEQTDFIKNAKAMLSEDYVAVKYAGMVCCLYKVMQKDIERRAKEELKKVFEYTGKIGDKVENIEGELVKKGSFSTQYGFTNIYEIIDGNNLFIWMTSIDFIEGPVILKGTLKDHREYNGVKQNILTRCKVESKTEEKKKTKVTNKSDEELGSFFKMVEED